MGATNNGSIPYIQGVNYNGGSASADLAIQAYGGNVGIGTTSPAGKLDVAGNTYLNGLRISGANTADTVYQATGDIGISAASASTNIKFNINSAERMRIDSSGNVLVGATSGTDFKFKVSRSGNLGIATLTNTDTSGLTYDQTQIIVGQAASSAYMFARYYTSAGTTAQFAFRGDGQMFATSTSISSISDARTKENVRESSDGLNTVLGLRAVRFDFKEGFSNNRKNQLGFIAQEIEEVFPDAVDVSGQKAEDGSEYKTVAPSTLIPVLVKAIQELKALTNTQANTITALTARIEALENK
jgi:hypothetical protein